MKSVRLPMDDAKFYRPAFLEGVELVSATYRAREFPMHSHDCFVVGTVVAGAEELAVGGATHLVAAGDVLRLHPYEPHANRSYGDDPLIYRVFYLPESSVAPFVEAGRRLSFDTAIVRSPALGRRLAMLHGRLCDPSQERAEQEGALAAIVSALWTSPMQTDLAGRSEHAAVSRARRVLEERCADDLGLVELSQLVGLSVFRFAHLFKAVVGMGPIAYRNQCRVNAAKRLLRSCRPISEIALELGFADQSHLTRHFQRIVGTSPNRYRQQ